MNTPTSLSEDDEEEFNVPAFLDINTGEIGGRVGGNNVEYSTNGRKPRKDIFYEDSDGSSSGGDQHEAVNEPLLKRDELEGSKAASNKYNQDDINTTRYQFSEHELTYYRIKSGASTLKLLSLVDIVVYVCSLASFLSYMLLFFVLCALSVALAAFVFMMPEPEYVRLRNTPLKLVLAVYAVFSVIWVLRPAYWWLCFGALLGTIGYIGAIRCNKFVVLAYMILHAMTIAGRTYSLAESIINRQYLGLEIFSDVVILGSLVVEIAVFWIVLKFWRILPWDGMKSFSHFVQREIDPDGIL